jgi:hypothetical protein
MSHNMSEYSDKALVICIADRYFFGFSKRNGKVLSSWSLAGAKLYGPWDKDRINNTVNKLTKEGKQPKLRHVEVILCENDIN